MMDKKRLIRALQINAYIFIALGIILFIVFINNKTPESIFLFNCLFPVLFIIVIPSFDRPFFRIRKLKKDNLEPGVWLVICSVILITSILGLSLIFGNHFLDLPHFISKGYSSIGEASISIVDRHYDRIAGHEVIIIANGKRLYVSEDSFHTINVDERYTFHYLPHTGWVIDIRDEHGLSLRKIR